MADFLELDGFELSVPDLGLRLSAWSHLYVSDEATSQLTCQELHACVRAGQLWFLPPRICYLQIIVQLEDRPIGDQSSSSVLEFLEGSIRLSTVSSSPRIASVLQTNFKQLWKTLGLSIKSARVQYETETASTPNLYFEVEHADKSSALLSPPNVNTSTMEGIVCLFRFSSCSSDVEEVKPANLQPYNDKGRWAELYSSAEGDPFGTSDNFTSQPAYDTMVIENFSEIEQHSNTTATGNIAHYRQRTADLAITALYKIIGVNKRHPGIRFGSPISTTLLELAPTVWNAHYMQATAAHSRNFSVISDIITTTSRWRPSLLRKVSELVDDGSAGVQIHDGLNLGEKHLILQVSAQERLWTLLKSTMGIETGMKQAVRKIDRDSSQAKLQDLEIQLFQHQNVNSADSGDTEYPYEETYERCDPTVRFESDLMPHYKYHHRHVYNELHMDTSGSYERGNDYEHQYGCEAQVAAFDSDSQSQNINSDFTLSPEHRHNDHWVPVEEVGRRDAYFSKHDGCNGATFHDHELYQLRRASTLVGRHTNESMENDGSDHDSARRQLSYPVEVPQKETYSSDELPLHYSQSTQRYHSSAYHSLRQHIFVEDYDLGNNNRKGTKEMSNRDAGLY